MREGGDSQSNSEWDDSLAEAMWVPGADYIAGWAQARDAADGLRALLLRLGCSPDAFRATAGHGKGATGVVRVQASVSVICRLVSVLGLAENAVKDGLLKPAVPCAGWTQVE